MIVNVDSFELQVRGALELAIGRDPVFIVDGLPKIEAQRITTITRRYIYDLTHDRKCFFLRLIILITLTHAYTHKILISKSVLCEKINEAI